ncbi:MAG: phosphopeptide-binding protein [Saprospiraceae bacterium]
MRYLTLLFVSLLFAACNSGTNANNASTTTDEATTPAEKPAPAAAKKYTLTPFAASTEYPDAKIESVVYKGGKFKFNIADGDYKLGMQTPDAPSKNCANSAKGQHIHLIVDNKPYAAKYEDSFNYDIGHGDHYILGFLSRSYHESIKTKDAHWLKKGHIHGSSLQGAKDVTEPMLFYSRPKGTYTGKQATTKVMLDFYLANVVLGTQFKVKAEINGEEHMIDRWQPYYIEGLPMGENTVKLTLVDENGARVNTPLNPVERKFTLAPDPLESAAK